MEKSNPESERKDVYITPEPVVGGRGKDAGVGSPEPEEKEEQKQ